MDGNKNSATMDRKKYIMTTTKLGIGTAQFGMQYGVNNSNGQTLKSEARRILEIAKYNEIEILDTAMNYGNSQQVLGEIGVKSFKVISKIPKIPEIPNKERSQWVYNTVNKILEELKIECMEGVLLHDKDDIIENSDIINEVHSELKQKGKIRKFGISIYDPNDLAGIQRERSEMIDIIQAPINIIDRRFIDSKIGHELIANGVEIHARSIFLQGLLLMNQNLKPRYFSQWDFIFKRLDNLAHKNNMSIKELAVNFIKSLDIKNYIVGIENTEQIKELIEIDNQIKEIEDIKINAPRELTDPTQWKLT